MAAVTPVPGVIRSARSVYWEEERGWIPVGKWIPGGGFAEDEMTVIREGTDGDDNWIVSEGGAFDSVGNRPDQANQLGEETVVESGIVAG